MMKKLLLAALLFNQVAGRGEVVISEFMAAGNTVLADENGDYPDWIELYNNSDAAVNLQGWLLTDSTNNLAKWSFPDTTLAARGFALVFASGKDRRVAGQPLHTNFKLDADGEYLALIKPDGVTKTTEFNPYPKQYDGITFGAGNTTTFVASNANARVLVPANDNLGTSWTTAEYNDTGWKQGQNGVGYQTMANGFACRVYVANTTVYSLDMAEQVIANPSLQSAVYATNALTVNYLNTGSSEHFGNDLTFPGLTINSDADNYVLEATATITIPTAGKYTFAVNSDDGFGLSVGSLYMSYPDPRGPGDTYATFNFAKAGDYAIRLVFYEQGGGSEVELFAAQGEYYSWDSSKFHLVGDTASGGLEAKSAPVSSGSGTGSSDLLTDIGAQMLGLKTSAFIRFPFAASNLETLDTLTLQMRYDDGFVAYLNGTLLALRNAPVNPAWNATATATHSGVPVETFDLSAFRPYLHDGQNVLAIHGLNRTASDSSFFIQASLRGFSLGNLSYNYLTPPTPAEVNGASFPGLAEKVTFSINGGIFSTNVVLSLSTLTPGASIRYTTNNTVPTESSPLYAGPVTLSASASVRARAFATGFLPSEVTVEAYTLIGYDLLSFNSNLPLIILNTFGKDVQPDMSERVPITIDVINVSTNNGLATVLDAPEFHGQAGLEGRGQTSWGFPKKPYNLSFRNKEGEDKDVEVLGMPAGADFVLLNLYNDKTFMNDFMAHELFEKMGHYAVRRHYVEVFMNGSHPDGSDSTGKVTYSDYLGIYLLLEKIKIGKDRVDIAKLSDADVTEPDITGGYIFKKDKDSPDDVNFYTSTEGQLLKFHDPKGTELTSGQQSWLKNYINTFESTLHNNTRWTNATTGYAKYIDVGSWVDYHWLVEFSKQIDGYRLSDYLHKDRGGKIEMGPVWDWNLSFGNANYFDGDIYTGWYYALLGDYEHLWLRRLVNSPGAPDFNQAIADRWSVLRTNILSSTRVLARMDELADYLNQAQARDFARWPRLGADIWPNPQPLINAKTYPAVVSWVKSWVSNRYTWIDSQYLKMPAMDRLEGPINAGEAVSLFAPLGKIYYTLDGTDPRLPGGAISSAAVKYAGPITLYNNARIFARALYTNTWSGPAASSFYTHIPTLAITEIMYHPLASGTNAAGDFQFLELMNTGEYPLALKGFRFTRGIEFAFTSGTLEPGQRIVLVSNQEAFQSRYGTGINLGGVFTNNLSNGGERLTLVGPLGEPVLDFSYRDDWQPETDGGGYSLVVVNEYAAFSAWGDATQWTRSTAPGGNPGAGESIRILSATMVSGSNPAIVIRFNASAGQAYRVEYCESLPATSWQTLSDVPAPTTTQVLEVTDPIAAGQSARYYRLRAQ